MGALVCVGMTASPAHGREAETPEAHLGQHHEDHPNLIGSRVGLWGVAEREHGETVYRPGFFVGLSYERVILHDWLEVEVSVPLATLEAEEPELIMPMDLHFKLPFHPDPSLSPYLAAGPALDLILRPDLEVFPGISFAVGTYWWITDRIGFDFEVDYNLVFEDELVHELLFATGPVYRF
ncbi:MAG: hypothetical protein AAGA56_00545 [Myxococcota bacterium]